MNPNLPNDRQDVDEVIDDKTIDQAWNWYVDKYGHKPESEIEAYDEYCEWLSNINS